MNEDFHNCMIMYGIGISIVMLATIIVLTVLDCSDLLYSMAQSMEF